jgi:tetratricopeptide (TPR) repeat protein
MGKRPGITAKILTIIFGLLLCSLLLELGLRAAGSAFLSLQERRNRAAIRQKGAYRIMCLGESTTALGGVYSYPSQLNRILNQRGNGIKFSVINKGVCGVNTAHILDNLGSYLDDYRPDMVITMMGINDKGPNMFFEHVPGSKAVNFIKSFRIYKLTRIIWLNIVNAGSRRLSSESRAPGICPERLEAPQSNELSKLEEAIKLDPQNEWPYVEIGSLYRIQGKVYEAEALLNKALELNPGNYWPYAELGWIYRDQGRLAEAKALFKKAKELNPKNDWPSLGVGWFYRAHGQSSQAEAALKKAIETNPGNYGAYTGLGWFYRAQARFSKAESAFRKAIELAPRHDGAYVGLGWLYKAQGKILEAEEFFKKAIEVNPQDDWPYIELGAIYQDQGKFSEAAEFFKKAIEVNPRNIWIYRILKVLYIEMGDPQLARECDKKANELRADDYPTVVIDNYNKLKAALDRRGIVYLCTQYPLRSLEPLRRIFQGNAGGIIFVDNQGVFQDALKKKGYNEYFTDKFGGDFGHCTPEGNRLLAENIANAVLDKLWEKDRSGR